ncbi:MAG: hypothetical protein ACJ76V_08820 [Thermoleophilaceae bacterium]
MKSHRRSLFRFRRHVIALACAGSLALPAIASARPMDEPLAAPSLSSSPSAVHSHPYPASHALNSFRFSPSERVTNSPPAFSPSASERVTDFKAPAIFSEPSPTVTVVKTTDTRALTIALSGAALLIALIGSGYVLVRLHGLRQTPAGGIS